LAHIQAKGFTDNVVDLMVGKLSRLPDRTQDFLKLFACLGNTAPRRRVSRPWQPAIVISPAVLGMTLKRSCGQPGSVRRGSAWRWAGSCSPKATGT
jgi:hypothetical protein